MVMRMIALSIVGILVLAGCGEPSEAQIQAALEATAQAQQSTQAAQTAASITARCGPDGLKAYGAQMQEQVDTFRQQRILANETPRMSMAVPLQRLLEIQIDTRAIETADCVAPFHGLVLTMMDAAQQDLQNFASMGSEAESQRLTDIYSASMSQINDGLKTLAQGAVPTIAAPTSTP